MPKRTKREPPATAAEIIRHPLATWQWRIAILAVVAVPLIFVRGASDSFRIPKLLVMQSVGIVLVALYLIRLLFAATPRLPWRSPRVVMPLVIIGWTAIAVALSSHPSVSILSLITVCAATAIYFAAYEHAADFPMRDVLIVAIPAAVNALFAILQSRGIWWIVLPGGVSPPAELLRVAPTAFLGNRNYAGTYLLVPVIICVAVLLVARRRTRFRVGATLALLLAGLVATNTLTALGATTVGIIAILFVRNPRAGVLGTVVVAIVVAVLFAATPPLRTRVVAIRQNLAAKRYDAVVTNRLTAYFAAIEMIGDHPLAGIGPGEFSSHYFDYKIRAARKYERVLGGAGSSESFGEAHNDLLQIASEAGIPAALLTIASLVLFASSTFAIGHDEESERRRFVRYFSLPAALTIFVVGLAQFPLQLPATMTAIAFVAGICSGWRDHASD